MTEATLIYNPNAGLLDLVTPRQLEEGLRGTGYVVEYRPTETVEDLDDAEARPQGMAWPDERDGGTVSAAAKGGTFSIEVRPGALRFLLPRPEQGADSQARGG
jgi:hypothetical protein